MQSTVKPTLLRKKEVALMCLMLYFFGNTQTKLCFLSDMEKLCIFSGVKGKT